MSGRESDPVLKLRCGMFRPVRSQVSATPIAAWPAARISSWFGWIGVITMSEPAMIVSRSTVSCPGSLSTRRQTRRFRSPEYAEVMRYLPPFEAQCRLACCPSPLNGTTTHSGFVVRLHQPKALAYLEAHIPRRSGLRRSSSPRHPCRLPATCKLPFHDPLPV